MPKGATKIMEPFRGEVASLMRREERFCALAAATGDWLWEVDENAVFIYVSPKVEDLLGYAPEEVMGKTPFDFAPQEERERVVAELRAAFVARKPFTGLEHASVHKDGRRVVLQTSGLPIVDPDGTFRGYAAIDRDITERIRMERSLRQSEEQYRSLVDSVDIGISLISPDMKILALNRKMREWFPKIDTAQRPVCYRAFNDPPRDTICDYCPTHKTLKDGEIHEAVTDTPAGDETIHFRLVSSPIWGADGRIEGATEVVEDVTARKKFEAALTASHDDYRSLTGNIPGMVYRAGSDWATRIVIKSEELCGYTEDELKSGDACWLELIHPEDQQRVLTEAADLEAAACQIVQEYRIIRKDGGVRWVEDHKTSRLSDAGQFAGVDGFVLDITERKEAQQALRASKAETEDKVRQLEETTAQLIQTEKLSALGELAAGVAHEMNQPLNSIKIICQEVLRDIRKGRLHQEDLSPNLEDVVDQVNRLAAIIDQLRLFVRRPGVSPDVTCDMNEAIDGVFKLVGQQLLDHGFEVSRKQTPDLPPTKADLVKLEQVLMNLITNARDAVVEFRDGGRRLEVRSRLEPDAFGPEVPGLVVEVEDNGTGVPARIKDRLFEPFFTTKEVGLGTGLGLSIAHRIVSEFGGRIEIDSEEGKGAVFRVVFHAARET